VRLAPRVRSPAVSSRLCLLLLKTTGNIEHRTARRPSFNGLRENNHNQLTREHSDMEFLTFDYHKYFFKYLVFEEVRRVHTRPPTTYRPAELQLLTQIFQTLPCHGPRSQVPGTPFSALVVLIAIECQLKRKSLKSSSRTAQRSLQVSFEHILSCSDFCFRYIFNSSSEQRRHLLDNRKVFL
jgi:hypothetical protein